MSMNINNYSQFYKGAEQLKKYGSGQNGKDTLVRYEFNTTDAQGNKVMDKMSREETLQAMKEISAQYGDNVIVEFSGDGMAKLIESRKGYIASPLSEEEVAAKQKEFDSQVVQIEGTYKKVEGNVGVSDDDFHTILKENNPELARQIEDMNQRIINHKPGDSSNAAEFNKLMKEAMNVVNTAREEKENAVSGKQNNAELNLSDKAKKLLEELRKDFGDMEFFVFGTGSDAKSLLAGSTKEFSVLFSAEELEKMASDEKYKKQRINGIQGAVRMSEAINEKYGYERAFGKQNNEVAISKIAISFNEDGSTTMFAELEKMSKQQRENIEAAKEKRAEEKKAAEKKAAEKEQEPIKRTIVSASSMDELIDKINEVDWSKVKEESNVGSRFDFSV